jgi:predicted  nucleic acid-binding Zn-ribbon protein
MSQISDIQTLQEFDDQAAAQKSQLADVQRRIAGDEALEAARAALAAAERAATPVRKDETRLEDQVQALESKIEQEQKRLYSGTVTSPKELQNIQHEVDSLKEQHARLEDQLIEVELRLEELNGAVETASQDVKQREAERASSLPRWETEVQSLNQSITRLEARRAGVRAAIPPRALAVYDRVRERRGGMAVARLQGNTCTACRVSMPDSVRRQLFAPDALVQCPNCERILFMA